MAARPNAYSSVASRVCVALAPPTWGNGPRLSGSAWAVLFAAIASNASAVDPAEALKNAPIDDAEFRIPLEPDEASALEKLVPFLGSPDYQQREEASKGLVEIGAPVFARLREVYRQSSDFETRARIERIVRDAYLDHHLYRNFGFLGISRNMYTPGADDDPRIPRGHFGLKVDNVTKNSGAERAGIQQNDVIIALDGEPLQGVGQKTFELFSAEIRSRGPGGKVMLGILRGPQELTVEATLTRPPINSADGRNTQKLTEATGHARDRFEVWWRRYFREPETDDIK